MNSNVLKPLIPELFMLASAIYYWLATSLFNPIALCLILVVGFQIYKQNTGLGFFMAFVFIGLNLFMVLALISELSEFQTTNRSYVIRLTVGSLYLLANLITGTFMLIKYIKQAYAKELHSS